MNDYSFFSAPQLKCDPLGGTRSPSSALETDEDPPSIRRLGALHFTGIAAAVALTHMDNLPAFIMIAPGYLVQAWLFETHRALGGFGYQVTMVGVSALVWSLLILTLAVGVRLLRRLMRRPRAA